jgi:hypothetical protein
VVFTFAYRRLRYAEQALEMLFNCSFERKRYFFTLLSHLTFVLDIGFWYILVQDDLTTSNQIARMV